jgi:hypothetical protein
LVGNHEFFQFSFDTEVFDKAVKITVAGNNHSLIVVGITARLAGRNTRLASETVKDYVVDNSTELFFRQ